MNDNRKTKDQLIQELEDLRRRIAELEKSETERKRVEEVLKRSEEYFRAITENSLDIILVVDKKGTITYTSPSVDHILGYKPEELIGKRSLDLIVPADFQKAIHNFGQAISTKGVLVPNAFHVRHKDGSERVLEGTGKNLFDNPSVAGFVMNVRDVSDSKKAEETLLSEKQLSDSTINSLPGIFYLFDDQGRFQRWNKNFEKVSGYSAEEISRMHPLNFFTGEEKQLVEQAIQKVFTKGENTVEAEFVSRDERRTPYLLTGVRITIGNTKCLIGMGIDITDRKRAEEDLRESEERYRTILEDIDEGYYENDLAGNFTFVNDAECRDLGYSREELIGMNYRQVSNEATAKNLYEIFYNIYNTGKPVKRFPEQYISKDGTRHFNEVSASLIRDAKGKPIGFRGLSRDITDRKRAEGKLRESEEKYRNILENIEDGYFEVDLAGNFTFFNPSLCRILGYPREEMTGMNNRVFMDAENAKKAFRTFNEVYETGIPTKGFEWETIRRDGTRAYIEVSLSLIVIPGEKPTGFRGIARDVTERKEAEQKLKESEEEYRKLFQNANEAIFVAQDGKLVFLNPMTIKMIGYSGEELISRSFITFIHQDDRNMVIDRHIRRMKGEEVPHLYSFRIIQRNGSIKWAELNSVLIQWKKKAATLNFLTDITDRKQAEEAIRESEERYRQVVKNANEAIFIIQDETIKFFNPKALEIYGYSPDENLPPVYSFIEFIHPEDHEIVLERYQKRLKGEDLPNVYPIRIIDRQGSIRWVEINSILISWEGRPAALVFLNDIKERKQAEEALKTLSLRDDLTGLFNRRGFFTLAEQGLKTAQRMGTEMLLIFGDLDNLKGINDTFGHKEGDQALVDISQILKDTFRESDIIARIGGDEFVILAMNSFETSAEKLISRFEQVLNDHPLQTKRPYTLSLSLGITYFNPQNPCSIEVLLTEADKIMYENKQKKSR